MEGRGRLRPEPDGITGGRVHTSILTPRWGSTTSGHLGGKLGCAGMRGCTHEHEVWLQSRKHKITQVKYTRISFLKEKKWKSWPRRAGVFAL